MLLHGNDFLNEIAKQIDPVSVFRSVVGEPDPWQLELLNHPADDPILLCLCSRGTGKSQTIAVKAFHHADTYPGSTVLIIAPSLRQSLELYRYVKHCRDALPLASPSTKETETEMHLANKSRIVVLPGSSPDTIRGYRCSLLLLEEAARLTDDIFSASVPMVLQRGQIIAVTTPAGQVGWFPELWLDGKVARITARSTEIPRLKEVVERDRLIMRTAAFNCEHLLQWSQTGTNFFDYEVIAKAFTDDVPPMALPWL